MNVFSVGRDRVPGRWTRDVFGSSRFFSVGAVVTVGMAFGTPAVEGRVADLSLRTPGIVLVRNNSVA